MNKVVPTYFPDLTNILKDIIQTSQNSFPDPASIITPLGDAITESQDAYILLGSVVGQEAYNNALIHINELAFLHMIKGIFEHRQISYDIDHLVEIFSRSDLPRDKHPFDNLTKISEVLIAYYPEHRDIIQETLDHFDYILHEECKNTILTLIRSANKDIHTLYFHFVTYLHNELMLDSKNEGLSITWVLHLLTDLAYLLREEPYELSFDHMEELPLIADTVVKDFIASHTELSDNLEPYKYMALGQYIENQTQIPAQDISRAIWHMQYR